MFRLDKPIAIRLTNDDADRLQELAEDNFVCISKYCRAVLKEHIDENEQKGIYRSSLQAE